MSSKKVNEKDVDKFLLYQNFSCNIRNIQHHQVNKLLIHADSNNNDDTSDLPTTLLIKELKNFKATIFFFFYINSYNIVITFPFHKCGTQDPEKVVKLSIISRADNIPLQVS